MIEALNSLMLPIQLDRGCLGCQLYKNTDESNSFFYIEQWARQQDLEREIRSDRFTRLLSVMESSPEPPVLEFWFDWQARGLDYIAKVRQDTNFSG